MFSSKQQFKLFISKDFDYLKDLPAFCQNNQVSLAAHSFLQFEEVSFVVHQEYDVLFFASSNAVHFAFNSLNFFQKKVAVAGIETKKLLESKGIQVDFCPEQSGLIEQNSILFKKWLGTKRVLFPVSSISKRSYAKYLDQSQCEFAVAYNTIIKTKSLEKYDCVVFTSPSNVKGFFESNLIDASTKVIAWGESTHRALAEYVDVSTAFCLKESSEESLIEFLKNNLEFYD